MNLKTKRQRLSVGHCSVIVLLLICSFIIIRRKAAPVTAAFENVSINHTPGRCESRVQGARSFARSTRNSDQNLSQTVDNYLTRAPFSVNGFSPIAAKKYGFDQKTINLLNSYVLQARVSVAKLISSNLVIAKDEKHQPNLIISYVYSAIPEEALSIKNSLIEKVRLATGQSFDGEINSMLGSSPAFLFCGSTNLKFNLLSEEGNENQGYVIEYSSDTVDGIKIFSNYRCNLSSFSNSTLIDFDLPK